MKLLSFGEILWDIVDSKEYLGGAPFNLAAHAARCGGDCSFISSIGDDDLGRRAIAEAEKLNVDCQYTKVNPDHPTGTVDAVISQGGQPDYIIHEPVAYDFITLDDAEIEKIAESEFDVFCFGSLIQRSRTNRETLSRLLAALRKTNTKIFCDVNLRQSYFSKEILESSLKASDILKLNDEEVEVIAKLFNLGEHESVEDFCADIGKAMDIKEIIVTMGEKGALIYDGQCHRIESQKVNVVNTIGAGDSFSAVYLYKRTNGSSPTEAATYANRVAAYVCSQIGAVPQISEQNYQGELYG